MGWLMSNQTPELGSREGGHTVSKYHTEKSHVHDCCVNICTHYYSLAELGYICMYECVSAKCTHFVFDRLPSIYILPRVL